MSDEKTAEPGIMKTAVAIGHCQPALKLQRDTIAAKLFYRRVSYYVAAVLWCLFRLKPNTISLLSGLLAVVTILVALFWPNIWLVSILLVVVGLCDCADGALARYLGVAGPKGELADAIGGYIILWSVPFITWLMMFALPDRLGKNCLLVGLVTAIVVAFHYLGRSIHQKRTLTDQQSGVQKAQSRESLVGRINGELSFCGFMFPVFIIFWGLGWPIVGWFYAVIYLALSGLAGFAAGVRRAAV